MTFGREFFTAVAKGAGLANAKVIDERWDMIRLHRTFGWMALVVVAGGVSLADSYDTTMRKVDSVNLKI